METQSIGERIKLVRGSSSLADFAAKIGVHKSTLIRYEKGESLPDSGVLNRICDEFNINPTWLLTGNGPKKRQPTLLGYSEAHNKLREAIRISLAPEIRWYMYDSETPEEMRMTREQFWAYFRGEYVPTKEQLIELAKRAGFRNDIDFLNELVGGEFLKRREEAMTMATAKIDEPLMETIVIAVERHLESRKLTLTPEKKARLYVHLYEIFFEDHEVKEETVERVLRLVA